MSAPPELRLTPQRRAVLDVLQASADHPTAQDVFSRVSRAMPGIGFATVYRALGRLVETGQARELSLGDSAARYDANVIDHDHLVCDECGRAVDLDPALTARVLDQVAAASGFAVSGYDLQFRGQCPQCRRTPAGPAPR
ncbi:MAG TPA: transcriptional repressor [Mycobacteriales bacterium]|nr:transcriptional repressor [Mycobacteriales bacterium]